MDHRFREDENELPYLVVSKRDKITGSSIDTRSNEEKLDDIIDKLYVSDLEKLLIKSALLKFLKAKDCTGLVVEDDFTSASFTITRENDYIQTRHEFLFSQDLFRVKRVFWDCYTSHNHDRLLSNPRFASWSTILLMSLRMLLEAMSPGTMAGRMYLSFWMILMSGSLSGLTQKPRGCMGLTLTP